MPGVGRGGEGGLLGLVSFPFLLSRSISFIDRMRTGPKLPTLTVKQLLLGLTMEFVLPGLGGVAPFPSPLLFGFDNSNG